MVKRDRQVLVRLTEEELAELRAAAARAGMSVSGWVRWCARQRLREAGIEVPGV